MDFLAYDNQQMHHKASPWTSVTGWLHAKKKCNFTANVLKFCIEPSVFMRDISNKKIQTYHSRKFHCEDKSVVNSSDLHNKSSHTCKTAYLYSKEAKDT